MPFLPQTSTGKVPIIEKKVAKNRVEASERGPQGKRGKEGSSGRRGHRGCQGVQGGKTKGNDGKQGPQGDIGHRGERGDRGKTGHSGFQGPVSAAGPQGDPGHMGHRGSQGHVGEIGVQGKRGKEGKGCPGDVGAQGLKGSKGEEGDKGCRGVQGHDGKRGFQGLNAGPTPREFLLFFSTASNEVPSGNFIGQGSHSEDFISQTLVIPYDGFLTKLVACIRNNISRNGNLTFQVEISEPNGNGQEGTSLMCVFEPDDDSAFKFDEDQIPVTAGMLVSIHVLDDNSESLSPSGATCTVTLAV